jgi:hypothetical protein
MILYFYLLKKLLGFSSAGTINFDSDDDIIINAPKIYLGLETDVNKPEPAIKGENYLIFNFFRGLKNLGEGLSIC